MAGLLESLFEPQGLLGGGMSYGDPANLALLSAGAQMMQAGGPSRQRTSFGQALGQGLQGGLQGMQLGLSIEQQKQQQRLANFRALAQAAQLEQAQMQQAAQRAAYDRLRPTLPAEQQALFDADPQGFLKSYTESRFPDPSKEASFYKQAGNDVIDVRTGKVVHRAPFAPQTPDRTLVEIYDQQSPTGTRLVPRSEAVGKPGTPPSGTSISYDEQGRPIITMGRQQPKAGDGVGALPAEMAGKAAALKTVAQDLPTFEDFYFPGGQYAGRIASGAAANPMIGQLYDSRAGEIRVKMLGALDSALRLKTGAGMNKDELPFYEQQYIPSSTDNAQTARAKLDALRAFITDATTEIDRSRKGGTPAKSNVPPPPVAPPADTGAAADRYQRYLRGTP